MKSSLFLVLCLNIAILKVKECYSFSAIITSQESSSSPTGTFFRSHTTSASLTQTYGVLSKEAILRSVRNNNKSSNNNKKTPNNTRRSSQNDVLSTSYLLGALDEALFRQDLVLEALDANDIEKRSDNPNKDRENQQKKEASIRRRRHEVQDTIEKLHSLKDKVSIGRQHDTQELNAFRQRFVDLGFESVLEQPSEAWKTRRNEREEYGRPKGFDGLVFYSPLGVPILVGKRKAHKDSLLRQIAQGADLWFQAEDYNGSRVLLRTSLQRGLKGSKECQQMAADLAARYSDWYNTAATTTTTHRAIIDNNRAKADDDKIPVMYTDSKHVAKRGGRVGQMRQRKSLGRLFGHPSNVEDITKGKNP